MKPNQPGAGSEGGGEQGKSIDDVSAVSILTLLSQHDDLQHDYSAPERIKPNGEINLPPTSRAHRLMIALSPPTSMAQIIEHSWKDYCSLEGTKPTHSSTRTANVPQPILRQLWHWNSSLFPVRSSRRPVDVADCRDEDVSNSSSLPFHIIEITLQRYAIAPESDTEATPAMLRTNDDVAGSSMRPGQPAMGVLMPQRRPTQTQASTSEPEEIGINCCGFFFGHRRSN
ncbi:uncharacterized protein BJ212DRAFT_99372 [Suillus subaureus]|uniref:Uncharacterized protein n=1 Tax=Suillus subaureus TaxID=48587 RepID=A0A9P7EE32_9AGAM|nr:uncharacterized protein BJ212DRAFT_99372 [Suillus subaureus]KAG1818616.1 hypothetical protein BJ212DRAFT_99372 [Suillus subaureus]